MEQVKARTVAVAREARRPLITVLTQSIGGDDASDVVAGLTGAPKTLPCRFFYDAAGSDLFEQICDLPEYYPTRTEEGILRGAAAEIIASAGSRRLVELGSGGARKVRILIAEAIRDDRPLRYFPIDVSPTAIEGSAMELQADFPRLKIEGLVGTYEQALSALAARPDSTEPMLVLFLGSTIGNFAPDEVRAFLTDLRAALRPGDMVLVGIDLRKPVSVIEAAYNDSRGVTAAFNRNILRHLNRRFGGDFVPERFDHVAHYDQTANRIEMHLRSRVGQVVHLKALDLNVAFAAGETVRTEISRKFDPQEFEDLLASRGFAPVRRWTDDRDWFGLVLVRAA